jgi:amidase
MNRRNFLRNTSFAGLGLSSVANIPAKALNKFNAIKGVDDELLSAIDLKDATINYLQEKLKSGVLTSLVITKWYLQRINEIDKSGPRLNSVIELNPDALQIAEKMDLERKAGKVRGMLHGIPILIKDNIDTSDKMMTTAGSLALEGNRASEDAFIVKKLREAGAVLLGKANLSEFANFRSTQSTSGWSSRGGQTKCPYVLHRNPSGSSAGSAAAVAAALCTIAIGTETNGSIVSPSSVNGLVGIKPTVGLWSRSGIIPISATQDTAGPMSRTVIDAAILLSALAGYDNEDNKTTGSKSFRQIEFSHLSLDFLYGKRLGIEQSFLKGDNKDVVALYQKAIALLKEKGAEIVEVELLKLTASLGRDQYTVLQYEFKDGLNKYLSKANAKVKSLKEVIEYNEKHADTTMPFFKQEILISCEAKGDLQSKEYIEALEKSTSARKIIDDLMQGNKLDAICGVTNGPACCIDLVNGDYDTGFSFSSPAAMAGYPHITVPMGEVHHLPIGFSFTGHAYSEQKLIGLAFAFEQASLKRKAPEYLREII